MLDTLADRLLFLHHLPISHLFIFFFRMFLFTVTPCPFFFYFIFNWRMIALLCCVGFCHTTWISHKYTYLLPLESLCHLAPCSCPIDATYFLTLIILICDHFSVFLHFLSSSLQKRSFPQMPGDPWLPAQMAVTVTGSSQKLRVCVWMGHVDSKQRHGEPTCVLGSPKSHSLRVFP